MFVERTQKAYQTLSYVMSAIFWRSSHRICSGFRTSKHFSYSTELFSPTRTRCIRNALKYVPADKLWINPDRGFNPTPRWVALPKLKAMVEGTRIVRRELGQGG
jgi:hypothetical protein